MGSDDYEWIEDPVFAMDISPPVGWSYFPPKMLEALTAANMPMYGVEVTNDFMPVQIENPTTNLKGVGPLYGKVEGGAVTQTSPGGTGEAKPADGVRSKEVKLGLEF
ncbi:hypothetical protein GCK32_016407 [Trichostrongylus colubriformis]|uniref:Uncharacterized protein n=1 Tax=Trichostrongylus colubriformis TaxID=6319 RepID=A0AAN8G4T8_TRICO